MFITFHKEIGTQQFKKCLISLIEIQKKLKNENSVEIIEAAEKKMNEIERLKKSCIHLNRPNPHDQYGAKNHCFIYQVVIIVLLTILILK
jgi:hypothetical protein